MHRLAVTLVSETHVPDEVYAELRRHFAEDEVVKLTVLVATINAWNRIAISSRAQYDRAMFAHSTPAQKATEPA